MRRFFLVICVVFIKYLHAARFSLDGPEWTFRSIDKNYTGKATVPGDIYTDLYRNGIIRNPLYGNGDQDNKWVAWTPWTYEKIFTLTQDIINSPEILLHFESLDTVVQGFLNNQQIFVSRNQFLPLHLSIKQYILLNTTTYNLTLVFESPTAYAQAQSLAYNMSHFHSLPWVCNDPVENGECHQNFIRKIQSSFGWDWGPTVATSGIAGHAFIEYFNEAEIYRVSPLATKDINDKFFTVQTSVFVFCTNNASTATIQLNLTDINLGATQQFPLNCVPGIPFELQLNFNVPQSSVEMWYPNGYGAQKLYNLNTRLVINGTTLVAQRNTNLGFRIVELVQDFVNANQSLGRYFYFKINSIPIFLKGSNYVQIDSFQAGNFSLRKRFMFESVMQANMNVLRVWGGGYYETDEFYDLADQYGIMLWHDMMLACSTYSAEVEFVDLVEREVRSQVNRLRHHPSIISWAGNNENEAAIYEPWDSFVVPNYPKSEMISDYIRLYVDVMQPLFSFLDPSRPFTLSSPSNGIQTVLDGGFDRTITPYSELYGDVHYYRYNENIWDPSKLQIPRCATEFGLQSIPLTPIMAHWINASEWTYGSYWMKMRQHHPDGSFQNMNLTMQHFEIPAQCPEYNAETLINCSYVNSSTDFLNDFAYLSQVYQAIGIQSEVEHYRRYRSTILPDGRGSTMCALYWQLNDIWAAPTWASIDYDCNWKVLHYYARRFYAPIIASMYLDPSSNLQLYIVSDQDITLNGYSVKFEVFSWTQGFSPIFSLIKAINITSLSAARMDIQSDLNAAKITFDNNDGFVARATLLDPNNNTIFYPAILLPDRLRQITNINYGDANIKSIAKIDNSTYDVTLTATKIVPVLWLDISSSVKDQNQLIYWFSDNAFTMVDPELTVQLKIFSSNNTAVNLAPTDLTVSRIKMSSNINGTTTTTTTPKSVVGINQMISVALYGISFLILLLRNL